MRAGRILSCVVLLGCMSWTATAAVASVGDPVQAYPPLGLAESSGMAASSLYDGVVWVVEDTGVPPLDLPVIHAFAESGAEVGSVTLEGWNNRDIEALSMGPGRMLWVADIGDNRAVRESVVVHTFAEPDTLGSSRARAGVLPAALPRPPGRRGGDHGRSGRRSRCTSRPRACSATAASTSRPRS